MPSPPLVLQIQLDGPSAANASRVRQQIQQVLENNGLANVTKSTQQATRATRTFGEAIGVAGRNFVAYTSAVAIVGRVSIALSRATRDAIKFEREFVKLAQVLNTSVSSLSGLNREISALSREFGISANVIAKTSVILAQSGLAANDVAVALRSLSKTTLASTFQNIAQTTEGAIAIIAQFGEGAKNLEKQLGQINAVTKAYATESSDLIEAVRRGGAAFVAAGGDFTEFIALFTAVRSTTRESAETIATGFRTIFSRLQRPRTLEFFQSLGIQLENMDGTFVGAYQAIKLISEGLERLNIRPGQTRFAAVIEQIGGIRQVSRVIPLLTQFKKAEEARQVALAGGKSLDADVAKAQETTAQAIERTRQNFAALIREITQTGSFKAMVDIALSLANAFIEVARSLKPLIPLIATLGAIKLGGVLSGAVRGASTAGAPRFASGGKVLGFNRGGSVPGSGNGDTVPAMLEPGEFVIRKSAVQAFGVGGLADINKYGGGTGKKGVLPPAKGKGAKKKGLGNQVSELTTTRPTIAKYYDTDIKGVDDTFSVKPRRIEIGDREAFRNSAKTIWDEASAIYNKTKDDSGKKEANIFINGRTGGFAGKGTQTLGPTELRKGNTAKRRLNKIAGGLAEAKVQALLKRKGGDVKKLPDSHGADFKVGNRFAEVKTDAKRVSDRVLISKAVLAHGVLAKPTLKNNQPNEASPAIDFYHAKFAKGGSVGTDTVPALLTPGEFVVNKKSAQAFGYGGLAKINKYAKGGPVAVQKFGDGGNVQGAGGFDSSKVTSALVGVSFALSALTSIMSSASKDMQAVVSGLSDFGITLSGVILAASFGAKGGAKIKEKVKGAFGKGGGDDIVGVETEIKESSSSNDSHLIKINRTLLSILKSTQINTTRSGQQAGVYTPSEARNKEDKIRRTSRRGIRKNDTLLRESSGRGTEPLSTEDGSEDTATGIGKMAIATKIAQGAFAAVAVVAGGLSAAFTILSRTAELASERAIKKGDIDEALLQSDKAASNQQKATGIKAGVGGGAAIGAGIGAIFGPVGIAVGAAAGALLGLVTALALGENFMGFFLDAGYKVLTFFNDLFGLDFGDELATAFASMSPEVKRATRRLDVLGQAFEVATARFKERAEKDIASAKTRFKQGDTPISKKLAIDDLVDVTGPRLKASQDIENRKQKAEIAENKADQAIQREIGSRPLVSRPRGGLYGGAPNAFGQGPTATKEDSALARATADKLGETIDAAEKKLKGALESQASTTLDVIGTSTELARTNRTASDTYKKLNKGQLIVLDTNNIIVGDQLAKHSLLKNSFDQLIAAGYNQEQAAAALTEKVFGAASAVQQFAEATKASTNFVGSKLKGLLFGSTEEKLKSSATIQNAAAVAGGARLNDIQDSGQRNDVIDFSVAAFNSGLEKLGGNNIRDGLRDQVPQGVLDQFTAGLAGKEKTDAEDKLVDAIFGLDTTAVDQLKATKANILALQQNTAAHDAEIADATETVGAGAAGPVAALVTTATPILQEALSAIGSVGQSISTAATRPETAREGFYRERDAMNEGPGLLDTIFDFIKGAAPQTTGPVPAETAGSPQHQHQRQQQQKEKNRFQALIQPSKYPKMMG